MDLAGQLVVDESAPGLRHLAKVKALLVMSDAARRAVLVGDLDRHGVDVVQLGGSREVVARATASGFDAIILDGAMPADTALDLCRFLPSICNSPILVLGHEDTEIERLLVLELGGDDCVSASCSSRELAARVRACKRRSLLHARPSTRILCRYNFADWELDLRTRRLRAPNGSSESLPEIVLRTLVAFLEHPGLVLTPERLQDLVTPTSGDGGSALDWRPRIFRLRKLMRRLQAGAKLISTVSGRGYRLVCDVAVRSD